MNEDLGYKIQGISVTRPAPTKPHSVRCSFDIHDYREFDLGESEQRFARGRRPKYCTRCHKYDVGVPIPPMDAASRMIPPTSLKGMRPMPPVKPPKKELAEDVDAAIRLLIDNGYGVYRRADPEKISTGTIEPGYEVDPSPSRTESFMDRDLTTKPEE